MQKNERKEEKKTTSKYKIEQNRTETMLTTNRKE